MNYIKILFLSYLLLVISYKVSSNDEKIYKVSYIDETEWIEISKNLLIKDGRYSNKYCYYLNLFC